jgi:hypothetical protein
MTYYRININSVKFLDFSPDIPSKLWLGNKLGLVPFFKQTIFSIGANKNPTISGKLLNQRFQ